MKKATFPAVKKRLKIKTLIVNKRGVLDAGFALIATISVMVLLVMIAVAMLTLSSVELRSARAGKGMEEAKSNARLALMLAISELQAKAGPDTDVLMPLGKEGSAEEKDGGEKSIKLASADAMLDDFAFPDELRPKVCVNASWCCHFMLFPFFMVFY